MVSNIAYGYMKNTDEMQAITAENREYHPMTTFRDF